MGLLPQAVSGYAWLWLPLATWGLLGPAVAGCARLRLAALAAAGCSWLGLAVAGSVGLWLDGLWLWL